MGEVQRYELADIHGGGHVMIGSDTGDLVYFDDHADVVRRLEEAVEELALRYHCAQERCKRIAELTDRMTPGNAVHHARNIGTLAGAIRDKNCINQIARVAVDKVKGIP
jgi:hypothetical protein